MAQMSQICTNCGQKVSKFYVKCPSCGSKSLKPIKLQESAKTKSYKYPPVFSVDNKKKYAHVNDVNSSKSNVEWKLCDACEHKINRAAKKCPYCGSKSFKELSSGNMSNIGDDSIKNYSKTSTYSNEIIELKMCSKCGLQINKELNVCPFCSSSSFEELPSNNPKKYKWKYCKSCGENFEYHYSKCPYCNSNSFKIIESTHRINFHTPLKYVNSYSNLLKICPNCGEKFNKNVCECPNCRELVFESKKIELCSHKNSSWYFCLNCGENVEDRYSKCPYCNSKNLTIMESSDKNPVFSPLKYIGGDSEDWWKICSKCGKKVNTSVYRCPFCHNFEFGNEKTESSLIKTSTKEKDLDESIKNKNKVKKSLQSMPETNNDATILQYLKYPLFYRKYNGVFLFSRAKFINVVAFCLIFMYFMPGSIDYLISFIWVVIAFIPIYIITYIGQGIIESQSYMQTKLKNREDSLTDNIVHFLFYWHDEESNTFTFSKTKTISLLIYVGYVLWKLPTTTSFLAEVFVGLFLFVPVLLAGSLIHYILDDRKKESNEISKPKVEVNKKITHEVEEKPKVTKKTNFKQVKSSKYDVELEKLKEEFDKKEKIVKDLIEKRFEPPQITYTKFIASVDECREMFDSQVDAIYSIMNLSNADAPRMENEILAKIDILKEIIEKIDLLINELVLSMGKPKEDVEDLFDDMEQLIDSVKDYD